MICKNSYRFFYSLSRKPEKNSTSKELGKRTSAPFSPYDVMHVFGYDGMRLDCNPSTFPVSVITESHKKSVDEKEPRGLKSFCRILQF